jgi:hypothetical protein
MQRFRPDDFWFELVSLPDPGGGYSRFHRITCRKCQKENATRHNGVGEPVLRKMFQRQGWYIGRNRGAHLCPDCQKKQPQPEPQPETHKAASETGSTATGENFNPINNAWLRASDEDRLEFVYLYKSDIDGVFGPTTSPSKSGSTPILDLLQAWERCNKDDQELFLRTTPSTEQSPEWQTGQPLPPPLLYKITEPGLTPFDWHEIITANELQKAWEKYGEDAFTAKPFYGSLPPESPVQSPPVENSEPVSEPVREYVSEPADDDDEPADWWKELTGEK